MKEQLTAIAQMCLNAAYEGTMDFPSIIGALMNAGFEGYHVDYRLGTSVYYHGGGESVQLSLPKLGATISHEFVAAEFQAAEIESAVREAQKNAPGYTYAGFCAKAKAAGCAGYLVSILGRRVVYFGRTAETHVEHFPR